MRVSGRRAAAPASRRPRRSHGSLKERSNESSARSAAETGASSHAPGSKYGGLDQAQGHAETHSQGSLRATPARHGNDTRRSSGTTQVDPISQEPVDLQESEVRPVVLFSVARGGVLSSRTPPASAASIRRSTMSPTTATPMSTNHGHTAPRPCAAAWAMTALGSLVVVVLFTG